MVFYPQTYDERYLNLIYRIKAEEEAIGLKGGGYTVKTTFNKNLFDTVTVDSSTSAIVINNKTGEILSFGVENTMFFILNNRLVLLLNHFIIFWLWKMAMIKIQHFPISL